MSEEAQRVIDALNAVEAIADPRVRAKAISEVLADQKNRNPRLREMRNKVIFDMREGGASLRTIAAEVGVSLRTVQDVLEGYSGTWRDRPRKGEAGE